MATKTSYALSEKLKALRLAKRWTQADVARRMSVAATTYREWESGRRVPVDALLIASKVHETSVSQLLGLRTEANVELARAIEIIDSGVATLRSAISKL